MSKFLKFHTRSVHFLLHDVKVYHVLSWWMLYEYYKFVIKSFKVAIQYYKVVQGPTAICMPTMTSFRCMSDFFCVHVSVSVIFCYFKKVIEQNKWIEIEQK